VEVHPNRVILVEKYELLDVVERLSKTDGAVLVRELAREIVPTLRPVLMRPSIFPAVGGASGSSSAGTDVPTPAVHKLKMKSESIDRNIRGSPFTPPIQGDNGSGIEDRRDQERETEFHSLRGEPSREKVFTRETSPSLRASISSNGGVLPKLKLRGNQDGKPNREPYHRSADEDGGINRTELRERERVSLVSRKIRRAASEASSPLQSSSSTSRLQATNTISKCRGSIDPKEGKRSVSGIGMRLGTFTFEKDPNDGGATPPSSAASSMQATELAGAGMDSFDSSFGSFPFSASRFKSRIPRQKLNDVAAWLERNDGLEMD